MGSVSEDARCDAEETDDTDGSSSGSEATSTEGEGHGWRWGGGWWWETVGRITIFCGGQCGGRLDGAGAGRIAVLRGLPRDLICFLLFLLFYPGMFTPLGVDGAGLIRRCTQMMKAPLDEVARMHGDAQDGVYVYEDETPECIKPFC